MHRILTTLFLIALCLPSALAHAGATKVRPFTEVSDYMEGEFKGMALHSDGYLAAGPETLRHAVPHERIWDAASDGASVYFTTSREAALYRIRPGGEPELIFKTDDPALSAVACDAKGNVVAAGLGRGRLYRIPAPVKALEKAPEPWVTLPEKGANIWDLASLGNGAWAVATGPEGILYRVDRDGDIEAWADTKESNLMSLAVQKDVIYAGTSDNGLLIKVSGADDWVTLYDFNEDEVTAIALHKGRIWVAANTLKQRGRPNAAQQPLDSLFVNQSAPVPSASTPVPDEGDPGEDEGDMDMPVVPGAGQAPPMMQIRRPEWIAGAVYVLESDGRIERVTQAPSQPILTLAAQEDGELWAGLGNPAEVYTFRDAQSWQLVHHGDAANVSAMALSAGNVSFFATSESAAAFDVSGDVDDDAEYLSKPLDAGFPAQWGRMVWNGSGASVRARWGATATPDDGWSGWSSASSGGEIKLDAPLVRYLQFKVTADSESDRFKFPRIYFTPANQRPELDRVWTDGEQALSRGKNQRQRPGGEAYSGNGENGDDAARAVANAFTAPAGMKPVTVRWSGSDPNGDPLVYYVDAWPVDQPEAVVRLTRDPLMGNRYDWSGMNLPDGWYVLQVTASDELNHPAADRLSIRMSAPPVLVDRTPPRIGSLSMEGRTVTGWAEDAVGPMTQLQVSVDGSPWSPMDPVDGVMDSARESFKHPLTDKLEPGVHVVVVRAVDGADNAQTASTTFEVRP